MKRRESKSRPVRLMLHGLLISCFVCPLSAQKIIKDQREFELFTGAVAEPDADRKLELIRTWSAEYPQSEFRNERMKLLVAACRDSNRIAEAVAAVTQVYRLEPTDSGTLLLAVTVLPKLASPSVEQAAMAREAATRLRQRARQISRFSGVEPERESASTDADLQRLIELLREWRREGAVRQERQARAREQEVVRLADDALAWADRNR